MKIFNEVAYGCFASIAWMWLGVSVFGFAMSTIAIVWTQSGDLEKYWTLWGPNVAHGLLLVVIADVAGRVRKAYPDDAGASPIKTDEASTKRI